VGTGKGQFGQRGGRWGEDALEKVNEIRKKGTSAKLPWQPDYDERLAGDCNLPHCWHKLGKPRAQVGEEPRIKGQPKCCIRRWRNAIVGAKALRQGRGGLF